MTSKHTTNKWWLTHKALDKIVEDNILFLMSFFREIKTIHMKCEFSFWKIQKKVKMLSAAIVISALRVNTKKT